MTDIILEAVPADICLLNSGTLRSDRIHDKGEFKLRDLLTILPLVDPICVIELTGMTICIFDSFKNFTLHCCLINVYTVILKNIFFLL